MKTPALPLLAAGILIGASFRPVQAQETPAIPPCPPIQAIRATEPVTLDGDLSDAAWKDAPVLDHFFQMEPDQGLAPTLRTEVRVVFDDVALYVGARMFDSSPDSIVSRLSRRDVDARSDFFTVYTDPFFDRRTGYYFSVNAAGVQYDGTLFNDNWDDDSWDGVWDGKSKTDAQGWTCEMRIPFSQLRFREGAPAWGVNFKRYIGRRAEHDYVVYTPRQQSGFTSRFPQLLGLESVHAGHALELLPYTTTKAEYLQHSLGDPFNDGSEFKQGVGGDVRTALGSNFTLNATINPDFGQVEVDPAVVNLSDVETVFQEKRPFFVEGSSIYNFGQNGGSDYWGFNWPAPDFFYSRRLGRNPQGSLPDADYAELPSGTSILGAAKLSGRIAGTWNVGALSAITQREYAKVQSSGSQWKSEIEPLAYYGVFRGSRDFDKGRTGFGLLSTVSARQFKDARLESELNRNSLGFGMDGWRFLDAKKVWVLSGWAGATQVQGTRERITALQRNSQHYFQRPDAKGYLGVDSSATSLSGFGARLWLNKEQGRIFSNSAIGVLTPGFDSNDIGFTSRTDVINGHSGIGYKWDKPGKFKRNAYLLGAYFRSHDLGGDRLSEGVWLESSVEQLNYYSWNGHYVYNPSAISNRITRGGPLMRTPASNGAGLYWDTDGRKPLFFSVSTEGSTSDNGAWYWTVDPAVEWKPRSNVAFSFGPGLNRTHSDAAWLGSLSDATATGTFGRRYIFGQLDQTTLSANLRLNWTFTPKLSLQMFAQPLIASGDYSDYKEFSRPRSYDFLHYGTNGSTYDPSTGTVDPDGAGPAPSFVIDNPDFNFRSLRGNAVVRWEYMPGSALFLVWTQNRNDLEPVGRFDFQQDLDHLLDAGADNIFLIKASYYFSL